MPATAVFTPTTRPRLSASAPPELPGLSAASVWITLSITRAARLERAGSERPRADTTPAVTEPLKPCGLPIATTSWPTRSASASPSSASTKRSPSARTTARSESWSRPTTSKRSSRPSAKPARPWPDERPTTWAEVRRKPSGVSTTALPAPAGTWPPRLRRITRRLATEGVSRSATAITAREYASSASASPGSTGAGSPTAATLMRPSSRTPRSPRAPRCRAGERASARHPPRAARRAPRTASPRRRAAAPRP